MHVLLAMPPAQMRLFEPDRSTDSPFIPSQSSLDLAYQTFKQGLPAVEQR